MSDVDGLPGIVQRLRRNLEAVEDGVREACRRAGRHRDDVRIVAVTKYVDAALTRLVVEAGCLDLGESRPQVLWTKAEELASLDPPPRWHLVGHLQRNKVRRTLPHLHLLHSLDGHRLLATLEAEAATLDRPVDVLVEVNLTDDTGRTGVAYDEAADLVATAAARPHIRLRGLMGMAPAGDTTVARRAFERLRILRDRLAAEAPDLGGLPELSMGMSGDYEEAILEGSTLVRIGSALFAGID